MSLPSRPTLGRIGSLDHRHDRRSQDIGEAIPRRNHDGQVGIDFRRTTAGGQMVGNGGSVDS